MNGEGAAVVSAPIPHNLAAPARIAVRDRGASFFRVQTISFQGKLTTPPRVAIDRMGTVVAVWASGDFGEPKQLWLRRRAAGGKWGPPQALPASPASLSRDSSPLLAANESGRVLVAYGAGFNRSEALLGSTDGAFGEPIAIPGPAAWAVAMDSSGDSTLLLPGAQVVRFSRTGKVSGPEPLNEGEDFLSDAALATGDDGDAVLWTGGEDELRFSRRAPGRDFARPRVLVRGDIYRLTPQDVVFASDGAIIAAWTERPKGRPPFARLATVAPGGRVESATVSDPRFPVASVDLAASEGSVVAVWGAPGFGLDAAVRPRGGRFGPRFQLAPDGEGGYPAVALDARGRAITAWQSLQGDFYRQLARDFTSRRRQPPVVIDSEPAFERADPGRSCRVGRGRTLLTTKRVRIIGRRTSIQACYVPSGRLVDFSDRLFGEVFPPPAIAVAGPLVAYAVEGGFEEEDTWDTYMDVLDLRTGYSSERFAAEFRVTASRSRFTAKVGSIALAPTGGLAWIACPWAPSRPGDPRPTCVRAGRRDEVYKLDAGAVRPTLLDAGSNIDPRSLRWTGRDVAWTRAGRARRAPLR